MGFTVVALPFITLALGTVEIAHWFSTRQMISLALAETARAGSTQHVHPQALAQAFDTALAPRYARGNPEETRKRVQQALQRRQQDLGHAWQITVVSPSYHAFADFSHPDAHVPAARGHKVIRNSYQAEQHQAAMDRGWSDGRGPLSGQTVYEANTLVLKAIWPHRPYLPPFRAILRQLGKADGSYAAHAMAQGYLPLKRHITMTMQSHPVQWPDSADPRVRLRFQEPEDCHGWLCQQARDHPDPSGMRPLDPAAPPDHPDIADSTPTPGNGAVDPQAPANPTEPADQFPVTSPDDPACGVSLCCV